VPKGKGRIFEANVRRLLDQEHALAAVVLPLLEAWCAIRIIFPAPAVLTLLYSRYALRTRPSRCGS
jgi:hypothetical protein